MKVKFNTEQTEKENDALVRQSALQKKTIRLQQVTILSSLLAVILLVALIVFIQRSRRNMRRINTKLQDLSAFKDSMTHFLVHDLKNALNAIVNFDIRSDPEHQMSIVKHSGKRMLSLVHNLLDIGKFENNRMELMTGEVSLRQMIRSAIQQLYIQAGSRQITIRTDPEADFFVRADSEITERILINLLDNAIKHSPAGGMAEVLTEAGRNTVRITVRDHGLGIPADFLPRLFEKYSTTANQPQGSSRSYGLGLAFCKMAVEAQGGEIGIDSEPGQGTSVWFTLPLVSVNATTEIPSTPSVNLSQDEELPRLNAEECAILQHSFDALRELTIHQISDIKDILNRMDESSDPGIGRWKKAIERALYDCNSEKYQQLINLTCQPLE